MLPSHQMRAWMVAGTLAGLAVVFVSAFAPGLVVADTSVQALPFVQDWSDKSLITADDNWDGVPGIVGYRGDDLTTATGVDPQTLLAPAGPAGAVVDVIANQTNPNTLTSGGVAEFDGVADPTIALQGSGTADAPNIVVSISASGIREIRVRYNVRDIDGSADNAIQAVALQYRVGDSGNFTNLPAGFVADATTGPNEANKVTPVDVLLPPLADNQPRVELRIITTNAAGNDEWVGIDDISITGQPVSGSCPAITFSPDSLPSGAAQANYEAAIQVSGGAAPVVLSVSAGALPAGLTMSNTGTIRGFATNSRTFQFTLTATDANQCTGSKAYAIQLAAPATAFSMGMVQGTGDRSAYAGQTVLVQGVVTAVTSIGFFVQSPDGADDGNPETSDALFVYRGSAAKPAAGSLVSVTGNIIEYRPAGDPGPTLTQIGTGGQTPSFTVIRTAVALPSPVPVTATGLDPDAPYDPTTRIEPLERYENMRVSFGQTIRAVSPTDSAGSFYAVLDTIRYRPRREPGLERNVETPPASERPANAPAYDPVRFDTNPEVFAVLTNGQTGVPAVSLAAGARVDGLTGVLDYVSGTYTVRPDASSMRITASALVPLPVRQALPSEFTVATMNLERLADRADIDLQYAKIGNSIVKYLRMPDIIAVQEMASLATLQGLADAANAAAAASGAQPRYTAHLIPSPNDNIHVGFLVKSARVTVNSAKQVGDADPINDRPPLILRATINGPGESFPLSVVAVHQRSLIDVETLTGDGANTRAKRQQQTEYLSKLLGGKLTEEPALPNERTIVLGDFNAYEVNDGYVDVVNGSRGAPASASQAFQPNADNVADDYVNLYSLVPDQARYTYLFRGDAEPLDHILVNPKLAPMVSNMSVLHINAEFPAALKGADPVVRYSDHDNPVGYFFLKAPTAVSGTTVFGSPLMFRRGTGSCSGYLAVVNTSGQSLAGPLLLSLTALPPGAMLLNPAGNYAGSPYLILSDRALAPGESAVAPVEVTCTPASRITFRPVLYSAAP